MIEFFYLKSKVECLVNLTDIEETRRDQTVIRNGSFIGMTDV